MKIQSSDFSMYLSKELMEIFGNPYQSSYTAVRRFAKDDLRVYMDYERERETVDITGLVASGGITLSKEEMIKFIEEVQEIKFLSTFRIDIKNGNCNIFPEIKYQHFVLSNDVDIKIASVVSEIERVFSNLETLRNIMLKYREKERLVNTIEQKWDEALSTEDKNKKGALLEEIFGDLITFDGNFTIHSKNVKTKSEEIDIVLLPNKTSIFWSQISPPMIMVECKNWSKKIGAKDVRDFMGKIMNRPKMLCRIGVLIAILGFTRGAEKELFGYRGRDFVIATMTGEQILECIGNKSKISEVLESQFIAAGLR